MLVAALYRNLGYTVELTPPSRDGGRDVIATRQTPGQRELAEIECKTHTSPVGVAYVQRLRGVIERHGANRGVLVTISRFTRVARKETDDGRLELIDGTTLVQLLNANFGPRWAEIERGSAEALPEGTEGSIGAQIPKVVDGTLTSMTVRVRSKCSFERSASGASAR